MIFLHSVLKGSQAMMGNFLVHIVLLVVTIVFLIYFGQPSDFYEIYPCS